MVWVMLGRVPRHRPTARRAPSCRPRSGSSASRRCRPRSLPRSLAACSWWSQPPSWRAGRGRCAAAVLIIPWRCCARLATGIRPAVSARLGDGGGSDLGAGPSLWRADLGGDDPERLAGDEEGRPSEGLRATEVGVERRGRGSEREKKERRARTDTNGGGDGHRFWVLGVTTWGRAPICFFFRC
jgi:hypothetical protein